MDVESIHPGRHPSVSQGAHKFCTVLQASRQTRQSRAEPPSPKNLVLLEIGELLLFFDSHLGKGLWTAAPSCLYCPQDWRSALLSVEQLFGLEQCLVPCTALMNSCALDHVGPIPCPLYRCSLL